MKPTTSVRPQKIRHPGLAGLAACWVPPKSKCLVEYPIPRTIMVTFTWMAWPLGRPFSKKTKRGRTPLHFSTSMLVRSVLDHSLAAPDPSFCHVPSRLFARNQRFPSLTRVGPSENGSPRYPRKSKTCHVGLLMNNKNVSRLALHLHIKGSSSVNIYWVFKKTHS